MPHLVMSQDFKWHDVLESGHFHFGDQGYFVIDGSQQRIQCNRIIEPPIATTEGAIELRFRMVLGRSYAILLYDEKERVVVNCEIDEQGWIKFRRKGGIIDTQKYLSFSHGIPSVDSTFRSTKQPVDSDEHRLRFDRFNFSKASFRFSLDESSILVEGAIDNRPERISKIELQTLSVEPGAVIRVRSYGRYERDKMLDQESFRWDWLPIAQPLDGYPYDHISETRVRPVHHKWLQTITQYGWLKVKFPLIVQGKIEFQLMTSDIKREAVILLEEDDGTIEQGQRLHAGILREKFICTGASQKYSETFHKSFPWDAHVYFESPLPQPNIVYSFRVEWETKGYRMWVDGKPMVSQGADIIPFQYAHYPFSGVNVLTVHPGMHGTRLTLEQKQAGDKLPLRLPEPHVAHWGNFRIYDLSE